MPVRGKKFYIHFDFTEVEKKLKVLEKLTQARAKEAMGEIVAELLKDANTKVPATPKATGRLRASGSGFVGMKLITTTQGYGGAAGTPTSSLAGRPFTVSGKSKVIGTVVFNTPYAASVHEKGPHRYSVPGTGMKYLESKLVFFAAKYLRMLAKGVKV